MPKGIFPISDGKQISLLDTMSHHFPTVYADIFQKRTEQLKTSAQLYQCGYLPIRTDEKILDKTVLYTLGVHSK